jgi:hypothetical protein
MDVFMKFYINEPVRNLTSKYILKTLLNIVDSPRSNDQCERYNKTLLAALATTVAGKEPDTCDEVIKQTHCALNTTHDKGIDTTPTEAFLGNKPKGSSTITLQF